MTMKKIYKWHRTLSLIIAIPVILWAASGFMHPIMTTIRPNVATQIISSRNIDSSNIKIPLQIALANNHIDSFTNFRIIFIADICFYQIQSGQNKEPVYISTLTGKKLPQGEWLYAQYLARKFLESEEKFKTDKHNIEGNSMQDCCDLASNYILNNSKGSKVKSVETIKNFDAEYKDINKLLPIQKVSFERADGIRIYVETTQDRFAFAVDNKRIIFDTIFQLFHTWSWLNFLGDAKILLEILLTLAAFTTTLMGLYIFFNTKSKVISGNNKIKSRRAHRFTSISISLFTLMFTLSGAIHAFSKFEKDNRMEFYDMHWFSTNTIQLNYDTLNQIIKEPISNISIVNINNENYWQISVQKSRKDNKVKAVSDLIRMKSSPKPSLIYIHCNNKKILQNGDLKYANYLASTFTKHQEKEIIKSEIITKFEGEYGFVNKRLPVYKVSYTLNHNERYYLETCTGKLAAKVNDIDLIEGYSFSFLHKHHFLDFAGKSWRDFSTMFWAMAQIAMIIIGLILYFKLKK